MWRFVACGVLAGRAVRCCRALRGSSRPPWLLVDTQPDTLDTRVTRDTPVTCVTRDTRISMPGLVKKTTPPALSGRSWHGAPPQGGRRRTRANGVSQGVFGTGRPVGHVPVTTSTGDRNWYGVRGTAEVPRPGAALPPRRSGLHFPSPGRKPPPSTNRSGSKNECPLYTY